MYSTRYLLQQHSSAGVFEHVVKMQQLPRTPSDPRGPQAVTFKPTQVAT